MNVTKICDINELAQEFMHAPKVEKKGIDCNLMFDYESDTGEYKWTGITFINAVSYKYTSYKYAQEYMVKAYNAVTEIAESDWIKEFGCTDKSKDLKHYLVYFDGYGAYEFVCTGFTKGIKG